AANNPLEETAQGYDPPEPNEWDPYEDFGHSHWHNSLIWGENLENISILGPGRIDGKGLTTGGNPRRHSSSTTRPAETARPTARSRRARAARAPGGSSSARNPTAASRTSRFPIASLPTAAGWRWRRSTARCWKT